MASCQPGVIRASRFAFFPHRFRPPMGRATVAGLCDFRPFGGCAKTGEPTHIRAEGETRVRTDKVSLTTQMNWSIRNGQTRS